MRPPRVRIAALALLVLPLLLAGCGPAEEPGGEGPEIPEDAADFRLPTLDGRTLGPPDFRGEVVVVDFWATWCTPCRAQAKVLEGLHAEWRDRGVRFLAVDVAEDRAKVEAFVADNPFPYPVLLDPEDRLSPKLGLIALPTLMVVNTEGAVTYLEPGLVDRRGLEKLFVEAGAEA